MPLQVIYSEFGKQPGVINSFSAGPDIFPVCDLQVTITATVSGDLFGHTTLWEQISGDAVIFLTPAANSLVLEYALAAGSPVIPPPVIDDKVFQG